MIRCHTKEIAVSTEKVAITIDRETLRCLDRLVKSRRFANRSRAVQEAVSEKLARMERSRLAEECAKLNRKDEQAMAEEGMSEDAERWPEY